MRKEFVTIQPIPAQGIAEICYKLYSQGWDARHITFTGMIQAGSAIALQKTPPQPAFMIVAEKMFASGYEFVPPNLGTPVAEPVKMPLSPEDDTHTPGAA